MNKEELDRATEEADLWMREVKSDFDEQWSQPELPPIYIGGEDVSKDEQP